MTASGTAGLHGSRSPSFIQRWQRLQRLPLPAIYLACSASVAATTAIALVAHRFGLAHVSLILLGAVIVNALLWGLAPSLYSVVLSIAVTAFLFDPPIYNFSEVAHDDLIDLVMFTLGAVLTSNLAARLQAYAADAERRATVAAELQVFSRRLAEIADADELYLTVVELLEELLGSRVLILLPQRGGIVVLAAQMQDRPAPAAVEARASALWAERERAGAAPETEVEGWLLRLLRTWRGPVCLVAVAPGADRPYPVADLTPVLDQAAVAIERTLLARAIENARMQRAREDLQEALISSMSHSLQTPLASIIGSVTSLQGAGAAGNAAAATELVATIREEAERLERFVTKILQMTRIRAGAIAPRLELVELPDIINAALRRLRRVLAGHRVDLSLPADPPMLLLDLFLMEEAIANLLENAAKYAPRDTTIRVRVTADATSLTLDVADEGSGIAPAAIPLLFDPFYRAGATDSKAPGTGLGLAICRTFVQANNGTVAAIASEAGAVFRITLPVPPQPKGVPGAMRDE